MTKVRAAVVCENSLYRIAVKHNFSDFLYLGKSELADRTGKKEAILADSVEALIAAICLDSDVHEAERFIIENLKEAVKEASNHVGIKDHKTMLQEKLQQRGDVVIQYIVTGESGPDHRKTFMVEVRCNGKFLARGSGETKKAAEMQAAQRALEDLSK